MTGTTAGFIVFAWLRSQAIPEAVIPVRPDRPRFDAQDVRNDLFTLQMRGAQGVVDGIDWQKMLAVDVPQILPALEGQFVPDTVGIPTSFQSYPHSLHPGLAGPDFLGSLLCVVRKVNVVFLDEKLFFRVFSLCISD